MKENCNCDGCIIRILHQILLQYHLKHLGLDERIILKCILKKQDDSVHFIPVSQTLMMEVEISSETLVNIYQTTRCNIPEYILLPKCSSTRKPEMSPISLKFVE
jgi:hypothetical protein